MLVVDFSSFRLFLLSDATLVRRLKNAKIDEARRVAVAVGVAAAFGDCNYDRRT